MKQRPARRAPGQRSIVLYEANARGEDVVLLATSDPRVVAAVERALLDKIAEPRPDPESLKPVPDSEIPF